MEVCKIIKEKKRKKEKGKRILVTMHVTFKNNLFSKLEFPPNLRCVLTFVLKNKTAVFGIGRMQEMKQTCWKPVH
jgi:hypothetical protein